MSKKDINQHLELVKKMFHDNNSLLWVRLMDYKYPRMALLLLSQYQKEALCEAHNSIFGSHDAILNNDILLAWNLTRCKGSCKNLPHMPTMKTDASQAYTFISTANSGMTEQKTVKKNLCYASPLYSLNKL